MKAVNNSHAIWSCLLLALAVAAGAFGAHLLRNVLGERGNEVWKTAVMYHFIHGLAILVFAVTDPVKFRLTNRLLLAGVLMFSGSLYLLAHPAITGSGLARVLGPVTPIGGVLFIAGWITSALAIFRNR